jgi:phosphatidylglycerol:prolipoprotein diacylglycerol transferase
MPMLSAVVAHLLTIEIGLDPEIRDFGGLLLTWHGVFTAVGIAAGVWLAVILGRRKGFLEDDIYSAALLAIPFGIVGARALFVVENWGEPGVENALDVIRLNEGGISIYGAMLGGLLGGFIYVWFRRLPILKGFDVAIVGLLTGMAIGRIGDLINGEHFAEASGLPWAIRYTNLNSPSVVAYPNCPTIDIATGKCLVAQHPAVGYELIADILIVALAFLIFRYVRRDGVAFFAGMLAYSLMRFWVSELRIDSETIVWGLSTPQVVSLCITPVAAIGFVWALLREPTPERAAEPAPAPRGQPRPQPARR